MRRDHLEYEMLCALDAAGQLSEGEASDLREHVSVCPLCRQCLAEMAAASCSFFVRQSGQAKGVNTPAGMQKRFEDRAKSVGIPLRDKTPVLLGAPFISFALSAVLLAVAGQVGWKTLHPRGRTLETTSVRHPQDAPAAREAVAANSPPQRPSRTLLKRKGDSIRLPHTGPHASLRGRTHDGYADSHPVETPSLKQRDLEAYAGSRNLFLTGAVEDYQPSALHLPGRRTFELAYVPGLMGGGEGFASTQRAFRYTPNFASSSLLGAPESINWTRIPAMNEQPSLFRVSVARN